MNSSNPSPAGQRSSPNGLKKGSPNLTAAPERRISLSDGPDPVCDEIIQSEISYVADLQLVKSAIMEPAAKVRP